MTAIRLARAKTLCACTEAVWKRTCQKRRGHDKTDPLHRWEGVNRAGQYRSIVWTSAPLSDTSIAPKSVTPPRSGHYDRPVLTTDPTGIDET